MFPQKETERKIHWDNIRTHCRSSRGLDHMFLVGESNDTATEFHQGQPQYVQKLPRVESERAVDKWALLCSTLTAVAW